LAKPVPVKRLPSDSVQWFTAVLSGLVLVISCCGVLSLLSVSEPVMGLLAMLLAESVTTRLLVLQDLYQQLLSK